MAFLLAGAESACSYNPSVASCTITCTDSDGCPKGLTCNGGFCAGLAVMCPASGGGTGGQMGIGLPDAESVVDVAIGGAGDLPPGSPDLAAEKPPVDQAPCPVGADRCGAVCTDITRSTSNCGRCDHACGGGLCMQGVCQPATLTGIVGASSIAVDDSTLYFTVANTVRSCRKNGCVLAPLTLAEMTYPTHDVKAANGGVYFISAPTQNTERYTLYVCPPAGCPGNVPKQVAFGGLNGIDNVTVRGDRLYWIITGVQRATCQPGGLGCSAATTIGPSGVNALSASDEQIFFLDTVANGGGLARCPLAGGGCPTAGMVVPTKLSSQTPAETFFFQGLLYFLVTGREGYSDGAIRTCTPTDCDGRVPKDFAAHRELPKGLYVDADGVYWIDGNAVRGCPLTGCVGAPRTFGTGLAGTTEVTTDDAFVYWIGTATGTVSRVAK